MLALSQRQLVLAVLALATLIATILVPYALMRSSDPVILFASVGGAASFGGLWLAYWRGWESARYVTVAAITLLSAIATPVTTATIPATALIVPILALVLTGPSWVIGSAAAQMAVLLGRAYLGAGGNIAAMSGFGNLAELLLYTLAISGLVLSRTMVESLLRVARESALRDAEARARAEEQSRVLAEQAASLDRQIDEQQRLLDLVSSLETPAVRLADGVLLAPVVGTLDSRRITSLTTRLLAAAAEQRAQMIVLDIAGVPAVDSAAARALLDTVQALRLLGCQVTLTGISAAVATSLTGLDMSLADVRVARSPQDVLRTA